MFDTEKLDADIIATPDHARTLPCIRAVQAGYDVYAEKPLTAYIKEGRILVAKGGRGGRGDTGGGRLRGRVRVGGAARRGPGRDLAVSERPA